jgi:hypothetical protein
LVPGPPPIPDVLPHYVGGIDPHPVKNDGFAVASAVCGFTGIIPIVSQVAGLALGIMALIRIGRARRVGVRRGGTRWAVAGIVSSGFALACWVAFFLVVSFMGSSLSGISEPLNNLLQHTR